MASMQQGFHNSDKSVQKRRLLQLPHCPHSSPAHMICPIYNTMYISKSQPKTPSHAMRYNAKHFPVYLFLLCLYVNRFLVLLNKLAPHFFASPPSNPGKNIRRKFPQLMSNHILRNHHLIINLPIVNLKCQTHKIR